MKAPFKETQLALESGVNEISDSAQRIDENIGIFLEGATFILSTVALALLVYIGIKTVKEITHA